MRAREYTHARKDDGVRAQGGHDLQNSRFPTERYSIFSINVECARKPNNAYNALTLKNFKLSVKKRLFDFSEIIYTRALA